MQIYYGTYLEVDDGGIFKITIPENILTTSDFLKYKRKMYVYTVVPNKDNIEDIYTDEIQVCITPFSFEDFKKQYFFELRMNNVHGAFSKFLELFSEKGINILECRAIDSVSEMEGRVELLAAIENEALIDLGIEGIKTILNKEYKEKIWNDPRLERFNSEDISVEKENAKFISKYENREFLHEEGTFQLYGKPENSDYQIHIRSRRLTDVKIDATINNKIFLGITYESKGNYIIVKFKSINEIIVPILINFKSNDKGGLVQVIRPLSEIGVNLRLIIPNDLSKKPIYKIYFNIENSKLRFYTKDTIGSILQEHINGDAIESFNLDSDFEFTEGKLTISKDFIKESDNYFKNYIDNQINGKWINLLSNCKDKCNPDKCKLSNNWNRSKIDISNLIEQILNAKLDSGFIENIPVKLYKIKEDKEDICNFKFEFKVFHSEMEKYVATNNAKQKVEKSDQKDKSDNLGISY